MALWLLCQWLDYNNINAVVLDVKEFPPALFEK